MTAEDRVGHRIRQLRDERGWSVEVLAEKCGCNPELITDLEAGELPPSLAPLIKVARGLDTPLGTLMDDAPHTGPVIVRAGQSKEMAEFAGMGPSAGLSTLDFYALAPNKNGRHMEPFLIDVHPTVPEDCTLSVHEGEEFIYVLKGEVEVTCGREQFYLAAGDSIYYDSPMPHEVRASGEKDARILAVVYTSA